MVQAGHPAPPGPAQPAPRARGGDPVTDKREQHPIATAMGCARRWTRRVAGVAQMLVGARIPEWSGAKDEPLALGALTVALGVTALIGARSLWPPCC